MPLLASPPPAVPLLASPPPAEPLLASPPPAVPLRKPTIVYSIQQWTLPSDLTCADIDLDMVTQFTEAAMQDVSAGCN